MGRLSERKKIILSDRVSDIMLDNLVKVYGTDRASILEVLVRIAHKIHFGGRMYPELSLDPKGYDELILGMIVEEASLGGQSMAQVHKKILEQVKDNPVVVNAIDRCYTKDISVDAHSAEYWSKMLTYGSGLNEKGEKVSRNEKPSYVLQSEVSSKRRR